MKIAVILPTYNESASIAKVIEDIFAYVPNIFILVADDNSPDGTGDIVVGLQKKYSNLELLRRTKKEGLGKAYVDAMRHIIAKNIFDTVLMMDADYSHDPRYIPHMIRRMNEVDADVVTGSRYVRGGSVQGWELWRKYLSKYGNLYTRFFTGIPVRDVTAGFNLIRISALKKIDLDRIASSGYAFILELKCALYYIGARMVEIPIIFKERMGGESKISNHIIREGVYAPLRIASMNRFRSVPTLIATTCIGCNTVVPTMLFTHKNGHDIVKCTRCESLIVHPLPQNVEEIYNQEYFSGARHGFGYVNYDSDKEPMRPTFHKYLDIIDNLRSKYSLGNKLYDIGAATGFFLKIAQDRGYSVSGVELSDAGAKIAREKRLNVATGTFESDMQNKSSELYHVFTLLDVLEHVDNPRDLVKNVAQKLHKNGIVVINTPDAVSTYARILGPSWHLIIPPEHLYCLSRTAVHTLLNDAGLIIEVSTTIGKKFTPEYVAMMLYKWLKIDFFKRLAQHFAQSKILSKISLPINLRDNMFVIARKI